MAGEVRASEYLLGKAEEAARKEIVRELQAPALRLITVIRARAAQMASPEYERVEWRRENQEDFW